MTEQGCLQTGGESVTASHLRDDAQAIADHHEDAAVPCGQIGPTRIHLGWGIRSIPATIPG